MNNISLVYTFYNNQYAADTQCTLWNSYSDELKRHLFLVVVDDGSSPPLQFSIDKSIAFIHLRATEDIRWNQPGARNLGMKFVPTDWALITDSDHLLTGPMARRLMLFNPSAGTIYQFNRFQNNTLIHPHCNSFFLHRDDFIQCGGYDEDFCGNYGYDDRFFLEKAGRQLKIILFEDCSLTTDQQMATQGVERNVKRNKKLLKKKLHQINNSTYFPPRSVQFSWEIAECNPPLLR